MKKIAILLLYLALALTSGGEPVWKAETARPLGANTTLALGDYYLVFLNPNSTLGSVDFTLYQNHTITATAHLTLNQSFEGDIRVSLLKSGDLLWTVIYTPRELRLWQKKGEYHLSWGEQIQTQGYTIKAASFQGPQVSLGITGPNLTATPVLGEGETWSQGRLKVEVKTVDPGGTTTLEVYLLPEPELNLTLAPKRFYTPGEQAAISLKVETKMLNLLNVTAHLPDNSSQVWVIAQPPSTLDLNLTFKTPQESFNLTATAWGWDYQGGIIKTRTTTAIHIKPPITVKKTLPQVADPGQVNVTLTLHNTGPARETLEVTEPPLPPGLEFNTTPHWNLTLEPQETRRLNYTLLASPGNYTLPPVRVRWRNQTITSNTPSLLVNGPIIQASKTAQHLTRDRWKVKVSVRNQGNRPAEVLVTDTIPPGTPLLEGSNSWSGILQPGKTQTLEYTVEIKKDTELPPARVEYRDAKGNDKYLYSNKVEIMTKTKTAMPAGEKNKQAKHLETGRLAAAMTLVLLTLTLLIVLIPLGFYLKKRG